MFEQIFNNIDDVLRQEAGRSTEQSCTVKAGGVDPEAFDLLAKNPNAPSRK